ncbi:MAG TPA: hypothetical protein VMY42_14285 [Thermoguttaceae bacterium]|nr:hypothetical protein [Thermoguttaceae bacterium]
MPGQVRRQASEAYKLFSQDSNHASLRFKKVHATEPVYSARISIGYRAVGVLDGDEIVWFWIGSHTDYEKVLERL